MRILTCHTQLVMPADAPVSYADLAAATSATPMMLNTAAAAAHRIHNRARRGGRDHTVCLRCSRGMSQLESRVNRQLDRLDDAIAALERGVGRQTSGGSGGRGGGGGAADFSDFVERVLAGRLSKYRSSKYDVCLCGVSCAPPYLTSYAPHVPHPHDPCRVSVCVRVVW